MAVRLLRAIGIGIGTTWGTPDDLTSGAGLLGHNSAVVTTGRGFAPTYDEDDVQTDQVALEQTATIDIESDLEYHGTINQIIANIFGTSTASPAEVTGGQGDYSHTMDMQRTTRGKFVTLASCYEDDQVLEFPSAKPQTVTITFPANGVATVKTNMICDQFVDSGTATPTNTASEVNALSLATVEQVVANASTLYWRVNTQTGAALDSTMNGQPTSVEINITRPMRAVRVFNGASTPFIIEPFEEAPWECTVTVKYDYQDDAAHDPMGLLNSQTAQKGELFVSGATIGSGTAASCKFQFPRLKVMSTSGFDSVRGAGVTPTVVYKAMKASAAPTGMTGVTVPRYVLVNTRSTALI